MLVLDWDLRKLELNYVSCKPNAVEQRCKLAADIDFCKVEDFKLRVLDKI